MFPPVKFAPGRWSLPMWLDWTKQRQMLRTSQNWRVNFAGSCCTSPVDSLSTPFNPSQEVVEFVDFLQNPKKYQQLGELEWLPLACASISDRLFFYMLFTMPNDQLAAFQYHFCCRTQNRTSHGDTHQLSTSRSDWSFKLVPSPYKNPSMHPWYTWNWPIHTYTYVNIS